MHRRPAPRALAALVALAFAASSASAAPLGAARSPSPALRDAPGGALADLRGRIASARTADEARGIALAETAVAGAALDLAALLAPEDEAVLDARARLAAFEASLGEAETAAEVSARFGEMARFASAAPAFYGDLTVDQTEVRIGDNVCHYSTGELIVIIVGFILAIIPGIIFLFLLC